MHHSLFKRLFSLGQHNHPIDKLAEANSLLTSVALYPQFFKALATHQTTGISPTTYAIILVNNIVWIAYGIHRKTPPLVLASTMTVIASFGILILIAIGMA